MRFFENGPSIPAHLLEQRALGNVIVFCGAGISRRAGLPDFGGLTDQLIEILHAEKAKKALQAHESFDRVFNALIGEFGALEIDRRIYEALKTPRRPVLDNHKIVLDLSRNLAGVPQVVTTNFDLLFERAQPDIKRFVPPALPDLSMGMPLQGIVYLHGRLTKADTQTRAGYIISSADFGRAYLAEGWAARFVRALRERYTILLLGYSADDPPMRYLLEGLHSRQDAMYGSPIYAFASGESGEEEWRDRGVTPIAYDPVDRDHSGLWDTLSAWAAAAVDPDAWSRRTVELAARQPSELKAYERGQLANLISTKSGASLFADAEPSPPAEWLCVFDAHARYAKPRKASYEDAEEVDPLDLFGLDDDPARQPPGPGGKTSILGINFLGWMYGDSTYPERTTLGGWSSEWSNPLPERLHHLSRWFGKIAGQPAAAWWAAGFISLHPGLSWFVNHRLHSGDLAGPAREFWQLYLESTAPPVIGDHDLRWYEFQDVLKHAGWTNFTLRDFEKTIQPGVAIGRYPYGAPRPPVGGWNDLSLQRVVEMRVRVLDGHGSEIIIPDEYLRAVVELVRRSLVRAAELLDEIETAWWQTPTLHPTADHGETYHGAEEQYFLWFASLFHRLKSIDPLAAKMEVGRWDHNDPYFFGKLCIFAEMDPIVASGREAFLMLNRISDEVFFDPNNRRELLFTLRARWPHFTTHERRRLERRIIKGPPRQRDVELADYRQRRAASAASTLRWLELNGCVLTPATGEELPNLKAADPNWTDEWARSAEDSLGIRSGWIETVTELRGLDELPIDKIVAAAEKKTEDRFGEFRHYRPFQGLVETAPFKAVSALRRQAKRSNYPVKFWENLLSGWPEGTSLRLRWLVASSLATLPDNVASDLNHYIPGWLKDHLKALAQRKRPQALKIFDSVLTTYASAPAEATRSSVGHTTVGGVVQDRSDLSFDKAINSPVGKLTECLLSLQGKASKSKPLPKFVADRLARLFNIPGDGGGHAVCIVTQRMGWFDYYYRDWVRSTLVPLFSIDNPLSEAAWHGRSFDRNALSRETWQALVPDFLGVLSGKPRWKLNEPDFSRHIRGLVWLCRKEPNRPPIISFVQARAVLTAIDDHGRAEALSTLVQIASEENGWSRFVKPFIEGAWPRQLRYRSEETSRVFARLVDAAGAEFPNAVETVLPFLRPVPHLEMITYRLVKEDATDERDLAKTYPRATLSLLNALIADDRTSMPYGLSKVLEIVADADPSLRQSKPWRRLQDLTT